MAKKTKPDALNQDDRPAAPVCTTLPIDSIRIEGRHRKDMGHLALLTEDIEQHQLLRPILVTPDHKLIAGERRLLALKRLGWTEIPVRVVPMNYIVGGEYAEHAFRKDKDLVAVNIGNMPHRSESSMFVPASWNTDFCSHFVPTFWDQEG